MYNNIQYCSYRSGIAIMISVTSQCVHMAFYGVCNFTLVCVYACLHQCMCVWCLTLYLLSLCACLPVLHACVCLQTHLCSYMASRFHWNKLEKCSFTSYCTTADINCFVVYSHLLWSLLCSLPIVHRKVSYTTCTRYWWKELSYSA